MVPSEIRQQPPGLGFKRRAASCQYCQMRKIRCDRRLLGSPCTNCRLDEVNCIPGHSKRKDIPTNKTTRHAAVPKSPETENVLDTSTHGASSLDQLTNDADLRNSEMNLPHFIKPLPSHLTTEDMQYLRHKGIFELPNIQSRTEILRSYVQFVHPLLPLLDLETFLGPLVEASQPAKVSLLLFYAVMCSGAAHVHMDALYALGYNSRKSARRAFFDRARVSHLAS